MVAEAFHAPPPGHPLILSGEEISEAKMPALFCFAEVLYPIFARALSDAKDAVED